LEELLHTLYYQIVNHIISHRDNLKSYKVPAPYEESSKGVPLHAMMALGGGGRMYRSYSFLTSALDGGELSALRSGCALPLGKDPGTHCTGGWVGPRAGLDTEVRGKILCLYRGSSPDLPVVQSVVNTLYCLSYPYKENEAHYLVHEIPSLDRP
jgi:hypothetical protein